MRKNLVALFLLSLVLLSGCLKDPIQEDLLNYVNTEMKSANELENKALTAYESVTGANFSNDQVLYNTLQNEVIPSYEQFIKELKAVKINTDELRKIHAIYIQAAETQFKAFEVIIEALENQDPALVEEANSILDQSRIQINDYKKKLYELAEDHNVNLEQN